MNDLSKRLAALSPEQRAVFEQRLKQRGLSAPTVQVIPKRPELDAIPLSFGQQRLWFLDQFDPGSPAYNGPSAVRLSGALDIDALHRSLNEVVRRHEALRTTFTQGGADGQPVQVIAPELELPLPVLDLRTSSNAEAGAWSLAEREAEARRLATLEFQRPFDLERGPLVRVQLLRLDEAEHLLLFTLHHIVSDGWSTELLITEMTALYAVFANGQPASAAHLPEPAVQYADFAIWQREYLQGAVLEAQLAYWRKQLGPEDTPAPALLELPTDRPRPSVQSHHGAVLGFELEQPLPQALTALAQREGVTLFMLMLAAFNVLLQRWSGQDDLVVGATVSGRSRTELNNVMGFFANNLALRTSLAGDPSFRELVQRVRTTALDAYSHQDVPFEVLVEQLKPQRSRSHSPIFQVIFTVQNELVPTREVAGVTMRAMPIDNGTTKLDLFMFVWEGNGRLTGSLEYSTHLFDAATMERLIGQFKVLLGGITADPDCRISKLPLLTVAEQQALRDWNATAQPLATDRCIHDVFTAQAQRTPDATALIYADQTLSYRELDQRSNQVAHYLRGMGVGPDTRVGISVERSFELVIGLLGVLKAGAAYVPLDPTYPAKRLRYMLEDAQVAVLLTRKHTAQMLLDGPDAAPSASMAVSFLDTDWPLIAQQPITPVASPVTPDHPAYIAYTSGSTGQSKGVVAPHRGALNRFEWMYSAYPFADGEVCCQKTALSFVDSVWETWGPLLAGVPLVIIPDEVVLEPTRLLELLARQRVSRLVLVPSLLRVLLESTPDLAARLPQLTLWIVSGEALSQDLLQRFQQHLPGRTLLNLYGSSEVAADATAHVTRADDLELLSVPIGRPIANMTAYVLDQQMQPVPVGVTGELYIGGVGLAQGYWNRPALTAERFVPNQWNASLGARLYKTGDLARYLPSGDLLYLGRSDQQVKVRGFRIELGEIETVLGQHPDLDQVAVVAREQQLVAYIVPRAADQPPTASDLRQYLQPQVPEYLIPAVFVPLAALPLTPSGKLDRRALPDVSGARPTLGQTYVAPRTATEEVLARIWSEVLGVDRVGVHDNFFDLGGHSLRAILLLSRVREAFQMTLPLQSMFESATVASLAALLIKHETQPGRTDKIAQLLQRIKRASRAELQATLEQRRQQSQSADPTPEPSR